jgi:ribosomal protein L40E
MAGEISPKEDDSEKEEKVVLCQKCGKINPRDAKFCLNCGNRLYILIGGEDLKEVTTLFILGSLYLLLFSIISMVTTGFWFFLLYLIPGLTGLYVVFLFNKGVKGLIAKLLSILTLALGLSLTMLTYTVPAWIIFLITGWRLWQKRSQI